MRVPIILTGFALAVVGLPPPASADVENSIVYIECTRDGETRRGTGVIVSERGHVLTARHVVPDGAQCAASIGVADSSDLKKLVPQNAQAVVGVDAAILRFSNPGNYESLPYCDLEDWMVRSEIYAAGFPGGTETGAPSFRQGVLSTVLENSSGLLETDGQTIAGMSGGPVLSSDLKGLVGLIIGAQFDASGVVSHFAILPAEKVALAFELTERPEACYHRERELKLPEAASNWSVAHGDLPLGVRSDSAICFVAGIWGQMNDSGDTAGVILQDGEYVLSGINKSGGQHGVTARCIRLD